LCREMHGKHVWKRRRDVENYRNENGTCLGKMVEMGKKDPLASIMGGNGTKNMIQEDLRPLKMKHI